MQDRNWLGRSLAGTIAGFVAVSLMCAAAAVAEETAATDDTSAQAAVGEEASGPNRGRLSIALSNDFTTAYFFRGIMQERHGFIWEPTLELSMNLYAGDGALSSVDVGFGIWASYHDEKTLNDGNGAESLYEVDYYPSLTLAWSNGLETSLTYYFYTSPNGAFDTIQQIDLGVAYDDSELLGAFALSPYATLSFETDKTSFGTTKRGGYVEFGVEPAVEVSLPYDEAGRYPLTLSLPAAIGMSLYHYYDDGVDNDAFGFGDIGVHAGIPLAFIPEDFGSWSVRTCVDVLFLSDTLEAANNGDEVFAIWFSGVEVDY